ncbi:sugar transferase [Pontibacter sp. H259]|uniref:sugar transferase n=1 Tax=Pontibacter sp. H259 TaxID=3133421 RepID=UPI0030BF8EAE
MYKKYFKRIIDLITATVLFFLLTPAFLTLTLLLLFHFNGKPFFIQDRPGKNGKIFKIIKFRSMTHYLNESGELLPDQERITPLGRLMRKLSLDELPQLINVIIGDMSLVGPRPLLKDYLPLYNQTQLRRHVVRPGITGWAQVSGRNEISWEEKFRNDIWYVDNISFSLDLRILYKTIKKVLINEESLNENEIVTRFKGSKKE